MKKVFKLAALFVGATVCYCGLATLFSYWGININLMLVFTAAFCTVAPLELGYPMAFVCGLFLDVFSVKLFGNNAFSFTVAACLVYSLRDRFDFTGVLPQVMVVFVLTCMVGVMNSWLVMRFTASSMWPGIGNLFGGAIIGALLAPLVFTLVRRVWVGKSSEERKGV